jgi:hypothetical protein
MVNSSVLLLEKSLQFQAEYRRMRYREHRLQKTGESLDFK